MGAFHAYDIRGIYNKDFDRDDVYKIGFFLVELLQTSEVLVGRDARSSSPEIFEYLCRGITDAGADVINIGLSTTPMVYFATAKHNFKASVQITASHNPKEYNGLKISRENALPVGLATGLNTIRDNIANNVTIKPCETKGKIVNFDVQGEYIAFLRQYLTNYSDLKMTIDCSNGMTGLLIHQLIGTSPHYIYDTIDGTFPNHEANPLDPKNIVDLQAAVKQNHSDIGIIFDGDGDRVMFTDENSRFIAPDLIIALLGHYFLEERDEKGNILQDIRTSKAVGEYLSPMGGKIHTWRVGRAFAAPKLREIDGIYGGELAGHYYFRDFFYSDSGLLACILVLNIVNKFKQQGITLSQAISKIETYANSGEINYKIDNKKEAMKAVCQHFIQTEDPTAVMDFDGYRIEFPDWWFNIRPSNTEPYLRFIAEAKTRQLLDKKIDTVNKILKTYI